MAFSPSARQGFCGCEWIPLLTCGAAERERWREKDGEGEMEREVEREREMERERGAFV